MFNVAGLSPPSGAFVFINTLVSHGLRRGLHSARPFQGLFKQTCESPCSMRSSEMRSLKRFEKCLVTAAVAVAYPGNMDADEIALALGVFLQLNVANGNSMYLDRVARQPEHNAQSSIRTRDIGIVEANIRQDDSQSGLAHVARVPGKHGRAARAFRFVPGIRERDVYHQSPFQMSGKTRRNAALGRWLTVIFTANTSAQASFDVFDKS